MIIFGTKARHKTVGTGIFHCPHCQRERQYNHKQGKNYFSLYFIPVFPIGDAGEFIECQSCGRSYSTEVLKFKPSKPQTDVARILNEVKRKLELGYSIEYVIADLTGEGFDREVATNMVNMAVGENRKTCPTCDLTYAPAITTCPEDKTSLVEIK